MSGGFRRTIAPRKKKTGLPSLLVDIHKSITHESDSYNPYLSSLETKSEQDGDKNPEFLTLKKKYVLGIDPGTTNLGLYFLRFGASSHASEKEKFLKCTKEELNDIFQYYHIWAGKINLKALTIQQHNLSSDKKSRNIETWNMITVLVKYFETDENFGKIIKTITDQPELSVIAIERQEGFAAGTSNALIQSVGQANGIAMAIGMYFFLQGVPVVMMPKGKGIWGNQYFPRDDRQKRKKFSTLIVEELVRIQEENIDKKRVTDNLFNYSFGERNHMTDACLLACLAIYTINAAYNNISTKKNNTSFPIDFLKSVQAKMGERGKPKSRKNSTGKTTTKRKRSLLVSKQPSKKQKTF